jgi:hypothetical protein
MILHGHENITFCVKRSLTQPCMRARIMDLSPENDFMNILQSNYIYVLSANAVRPSKDVDFRIVAVHLLLQL